MSSFKGKPSGVPTFNDGIVVCIPISPQHLWVIRKEQRLLNRMLGVRVAHGSPASISHPRDGIIEAIRASILEPPRGFSTP
jgi:hypothetical protein